MSLCVRASKDRFENASVQNPIVCCICFVDITEEDYDKGRVWTHIGGETHDPVNHDPITGPVGNPWQHKIP